MSLPTSQNCLACGFYESFILKNFNQLGLAEPILRALDAEGYTTPTPIQARVIPVMLEGRDIVGIAQTGTGKTAAFVLPLLDLIENTEKRPNGKSCTALILAPTRELAAQIIDSIGTYGKFVHHSKVLIVGGAKIGPQTQKMAHGVDIIVATPGRLEDLMSTGAVRLERTQIIVLDEADQMMDLGFMPAIRRIMAKLPRDKQTLLLSATMPKQIRHLAKDFLNNPAEIAVAPQARPIERIEQKIVPVDRGAKRRVLAEILSRTDVGRTIIFTRTKRGADGVMIFLQKAGFDAAAIHGNRSQRQREKTMKAFRTGRVNILVATDIAARGIDVDDISHVINYELPNVAESYVHRIGRTARAGKGGVAISLCDNTERAYLRDIEKLIGETIPKEYVEANDQTPANDAGAWTPKAESQKPKDPEPKTGRDRHGKKFNYWTKGNGGRSGQKRHNKKSRYRGKRKAA